MADVNTTKDGEGKAVTRYSGLPPEMIARIEARKIANAMATEIAKLSWGQMIDRNTARAIAEWGHQYNVDVITEIDVLGNRVYLNARYYLRRLGELIAGEVVESVVTDHIESDARLETWPEEKERRQRQRIAYGVPDKATGACVARIKLRSLTEPITGVEFCGGGTSSKDPVGDSEPIKTSETRALRRAMRLLVGHVPIVQREIDTMTAAVVEVEQEIEQSHRAVEAAAAGSSRGYTPLKETAYGEPDQSALPLLEPGDAHD